MYLYRLLLAIFAFGLLGVLAELLLLEHFEDAQQLIPLGLILVGLGTVFLWHRRPSRGTERAFQLVIALFAFSGALGVWFHYDANVEFEREMDPAIGGMALLRESAMGAIPMLAPGTMVLLGAVGFALVAARRAAGPRPG